MPIGIMEVERADAAGIAVPVGQALRRRRHPLHAVRLQHRVGAVHVAHDDRDVLEPAIVAAGAGRGGATRGAAPGHELQRFLPKPQPHDAHARAGDTLEAAVAVLVHDRVGDLAEVEHSGVERQRAVHVGHRERDRTDRGDRGRPGRQRGALVGAGLLGWERRGAERQRQDGEARELHCKRSRMWSPTRSALAMMVRAGFTAPLEGKKLPSTT